MTARSRTIPAPLVVAACAMIGGIVLGRYVYASWVLWSVLVLASLVLAACLSRSTRLEPLPRYCVLLAIACCSALYSRTAFYSVPDNHIMTYTGESRQLATVEGVVVSVPHVLKAGAQEAFAYPRPPRMTFILDAQAIHAYRKVIPVSGTVSVTLHGVDPTIEPGNRLRIAGWMGRWRKPLNPGQADRSLSARYRRLYVWMSAESDAAQKISTADDSWYRLLTWRMQSSAIEHLDSPGPDEQVGQLLSALVVGTRGPGLRRLNETMARAGIAHYLSISGTHLAIFLAFIYGLCRIFVPDPRYCAAVVLMVLAAYLLTAEPNAPLLRASIMASAICLSVIGGRSYSKLNALSAAAMLLLAIDPLSLFRPGFQLSFSIVLGIIMLTEPLHNRLFGHFIKRRGLVVHAQPHSRKRRLERWLADGLMSATSVGLAAYITSFPLCAYHFGLFSPYGVILTILLAPLVAAVLLPAYISLATAWIVPNLSRTLGDISLRIAQLLADCVGLLDYLPALSIQVRPLGFLWVILCYVFGAAIMLRHRLPYGRVLAGVLAICLVVLTVYSQTDAAHPDVAEFHLLAVGHGQCGVMHTPDGKTYVFDAGSRSGIDVWRTCMEPFLRNRRLPTPKVAFISHAHSDHYNGLAEMVARGYIKRVYLPRHFTFEGKMPLDAAAEGFADLLHRHQVELVYLGAGDVVRLDDRTVVEVLWPDEDFETDDANEDSLVLRVRCDEKCLILPGDISFIAQTQLLKREMTRADALVVPHHGSLTPALAQWIERLSPRILLCSRQGNVNWPRQMNGENPPLVQEDVLVTSKHGCVSLRLGRGTLETITAFP